MNPAGQIPYLVAVQFHRFMGTGRTSPVLCGCEDSESQVAGDAVVKLRGGLDQGITGLVCELVGSRLATYFGLDVPEAALVWIVPEFADVVAGLGAGGPGSAGARTIRTSVGLNFGTRLLRGMSNWPVDKPVPEKMHQTALEVFAFDALIQNPDRRFNNTNLLTQGDRIVLFDHELAFSFLLDILPSTSPWRVEEQTYLTEHVFFRLLRSRVVDLARFESLLAELAGPSLDGILAAVPPEWNNESLEKIEQHLRVLSAHASEFAEAVRRRLA
ncbi:MAG: HipA family kinase [Bryobacteraceae bacterium]|nr:HipA family kinase [Bryobacteraceae bacterium]